jgi:hypothetical protein
MMNWETILTLYTGKTFRESCVYNSYLVICARNYRWWTTTTNFTPAPHHPTTDTEYAKFINLYKPFCSKSDKTLNVYEQLDDATETWYFQIGNSQWVNVYK